MSAFEKALEITLYWEGGYKVHKNPGESAITFAGIYRKSFPYWEGWKYIDEGNIEAAIPLVKKFYREHFWNVIKGDLLPEKLAIVLFEASVNIGVRRAIKLLQLAIKEDFHKNIVVDGILGKQTLSLIYQIDEKHLILMFTKRRSIFYSKLDCKRYNRFKAGWFNRTFDTLGRVLL